MQVSFDNVPLEIQDRILRNLVESKRDIGSLFCVSSKMKEIIHFSLIRANQKFVKNFENQPLSKEICFQCMSANKLEDRAMTSLTVLKNLDDRAMTSLTVLKNIGAGNISVEDMILQQKLVGCLKKAAEEQIKQIETPNRPIRLAVILANAQN
jgi:hypothetical protein